MSDVKIPLFGWKKLKKSANCFAPTLIKASVGDMAFSNADLHRAGQAAGIVGLSQHIIGKVMDLKAVTHDTMQKIVLAYGHLRSTVTDDRPPLEDDDIVGALLVLTDLRGPMNRVGVSVTDLSSVSLVSENAIDYALAGNRVTGGIVCALHKALIGVGADVPSLEGFATSDPAKGPKPVSGRPFSYEDLLLPLAGDIPNPWP